MELILKLLSKALYVLDAAKVLEKRGPVTNTFRFKFRQLLFMGLYHLDCRLEKLGRQWRLVLEEIGVLVLGALEQFTLIPTPS